MIGSIIGDVAGSFYEFCNTKSKDFDFFSDRSKFTDDSVLTVATADWLLHGGKCETYYADWGNTFPSAGYGGRFHNWLWSMDRKGYAEPYNSCGNGSAMRIGPVGWAFETIGETLEAAKISAECTHNHPEGIKGAQAVALCIFMARNGSSKEDIKNKVISTFGYDLNFTIEGIRPTYDWDSEFGNGVLCQASVPQAIVAFLEGNDFEDCVRNAISIGGDSDTIACITGSIAEAFYGVPDNIRKEVMKYLPDNFKSVISEFEGKYQDKHEKRGLLESIRTMFCKKELQPTKAYNLQRFIDAQEHSYKTALEEIRSGGKRSHWIWYIFPQQKGLGRSYNSEFYGLDGEEEAKAYINHPVLGARLREITNALLAHKGQRNIHQIMGSGIDVLKLKTSMTLFDKVSPNDVFTKVIEEFFPNQRKQAERPAITYMKAIKIIDNVVRYTENAKIPTLSPHFNVLVKVHYAGICRTDIGVANGTIPHKDSIILGHEFCGTIEGFYNGEAEFEYWRKGMAVSCNPMMFGEKDSDTMCGKDCDGAFAEYIAVPSCALIAIPDHLLSPLGAYLEPVAAALAPVRFLKGLYDKDICVFGDNRIAELTLQVAHSMGHKEVRLVKNIAELESCKYDCIIETEPQYINEYIDSLRPEGTLIIKSRAFTPTELIFNSIAMKEITILGARYGDFNVASHILAATSSGVNGVLITDSLLGSVYELCEYESAFNEAQKKNSKKIFFRICAE